jgi:hypothetical protein
VVLLAVLHHPQVQQVTATTVLTDQPQLVKAVVVVALVAAHQVLVVMAAQAV